MRLQEPRHAVSFLNLSRPCRLHQSEAVTFRGNPIIHTVIKSQCSNHTSLTRMIIAVSTLGNSIWMGRDLRGGQTRSRHSFRACISPARASSTAFWIRPRVAHLAAPRPLTSPCCATLGADYWICRVQRFRQFFDRYFSVPLSIHILTFRLHPATPPSYREGGVLP